MILVIDFGSQTAHLISRRVREMGVDVQVLIPEEAEKLLLNVDPRLREDDRKKSEDDKEHNSSFVIRNSQLDVQGIILSGGPSSVYENGAPTIDPKVFELSIPVLGICYGEQLMAHLLSGKVQPGKKKEYGPAQLKIVEHDALLKNLPDELAVWMSHGDEVITPPEGFKTSAVTNTIPHAGIYNEKKKMYAIQFHPEVIHTQFGETILSNFLIICGIIPQKKAIDQSVVENMIQDIRDSIGDGKAICALSGGVDSSVAALMVYKAIGKNLTAVYIDSGLMRENETTMLQQAFKDHYHMEVKVVHAKDEFLKSLSGVTDPEQKRKAIGKTFIDVLNEEAKKTGADFLVQGTIYPDVIESQGTKHSQNIKSHHNVGGLPEEMKLTLVEPLRTLYKDEVREIGKILELPHEIVHRQPFPGPGLAIRIIGEVTDEKLRILRKSDAIIQDEINKSDQKETLWQIFAVYTGIKTTGVRGDARCYGETIAIRAIEAKDAMSAHWARLPYDLLDKMSVRIVTEVPEVNRVVYDITNKPPATMEWE